MLFCKMSHQPGNFACLDMWAKYTHRRVSLAEYQLFRAFVVTLFQDTQTQTSVPAALSSSVGTQRDEKLWSQTLSQVAPRCPLVVVVDLFPLCESQFRQCKVINYVCIQIWFVKLMVESCVYRCIFKYLSCLYYLRSPSRETIGVVSIGTWAEKGLSN